MTNDRAAGLYLDLLKRCLTRELFLDEEMHEVRVRGWRAPLWWPLARALGRRRMRVVRLGGERRARTGGSDWPPTAETMIGLRRLDNLQGCAETVIREGVPGDFIETGVWRGGATIFMRAILAAHGVGDRVVWVADSFQGLPRPNTSAYPADEGLDLYRYGELAIGIDTVKANFARYGLLDDRVRFLVGWFKDTLPAAPIERLALLRLDGDLYESTIQALGALYPKVSPGGFVIIDDYEIPACAAAVHDYRQQHGISEDIQRIEETHSGVFWRRRR